jgi:2,3-dihydroxybenzoate-AMP ligase
MFDAFVTYHALQHPHRSAVTTPQGAMTFSELDAMVTRFAHAFAGMNLAADSVVAVRFANPLTHWLILLALARVGIASACAVDRWASLQVVDRPDPASSQKLFHASDEWVNAVSASSSQPYRPARPRPSRVGRVLLSSGTTGTPKRMGLSWNLINAAIRNAVVAYGPGRGGPWLIEPGIDTVFGFTAMLAAWAAGQPILLRGDVSVETILARFEPSVVAMVPLQLQHCLGHLSPRFKPYPRMRLLVTSGALHPALARDARLRLTPDIRIVYGASECGAAAIADASVLAEHRTAAGYTVPGAIIEIIDSDGNPLPCGEQGEVRVQTDRLVEGYLGIPPGVDRSFRGGWFYPGDRGTLLEDGLLLIEGRIDDVLNIGGLKLNPSIVDDALADCPGVIESFTFAAPSSEGVDECCIALVTAANFDRSSVVPHLQKTVALPPTVRLVFVDRMPRTPTGKVERAKLVELAASSPAL